MEKKTALVPGGWKEVYLSIKGMITVRRELQQQHLSDLLSGAGTSRERSSRDVPARQQITRVLLP